MKVKTITYKKLFNLGNYSHSEFGIEVELTDQDSAQNAMQKAIDFVEIFDPDNSLDSKIKYLVDIINNKNDHNFSVVQSALEQLPKLLELKKSNFIF